MKIGHLFESIETGTQMNINSVILELSANVAFRDGSNHIMHLQAQWHAVPGRAEDVVAWSIDPVETAATADSPYSDSISSSYRMLQIISGDNGKTCESAYWANGDLINGVDSGTVWGDCDWIDEETIDNEDVIINAIIALYAVINESPLGQAVGLNLQAPTTIAGVLSPQLLV